jgi:hypothetical protein
MEGPFGRFDYGIDDIGSNVIPHKVRTPNISANPFIIRKLPRNKFLLRSKISRLRPVDTFTDNSINNVADRILEVIEVSAEDRSELANRLKNQIDGIKEFLLDEIVPFNLAIQPAIDEVTQILALVIEDNNIQVQSSHFKQISSAALNLKIAGWVAKNLQLTGPQTQTIFDNLYPGHIK